MSAKNVEESEADEMMSRCASCGKPENEQIKLRKCTACHLVRYCGVKCQKEHRPKHKKECRKRAAELRDELLFKQPESTHYGNCQICCLPMPDDPKKSTMMTCCSKTICNGCDLANLKRQIEQQRQWKSCPFCRHPTPTSQGEAVRMVMKRVEANDLDALQQLGTIRFTEGDYRGAFEYLTKAATLGDAAAHYQLSCLYGLGEGVEKDEKKELYHLEQAAIGGHPTARYNLGATEWNNGRYERAVKHYIIAANLGHDESLEKLKEFYEVGLVSKDEFASTLRTHHAAVDATKSPQREAAEANADYQLHVGW